MSKKLIYLISFVLLLCLVLTSIARGADPDLLLWWKFDETSGTTSSDSSGNGRDGILVGDPQWVPGKINGALEFGGDGDYVVNEDAENYLNGLSAFTVCMWIKSDLYITSKGFLNGRDPIGHECKFAMRCSVYGVFGGRSLFKMGVTSTGNYQILESSSDLQTTEWQHVAMTWVSGGLIRFYVNGVEDTPSGRENPNNTGTVNECTKLIIGKSGRDKGANEGWDGLIDDVRIYDIELMQEGILYAMTGDPMPAHRPNPAHMSTPDMEHATALSWMPGDDAAEHDVYFGTDQIAVAVADTSDMTGIYRGRQDPNTYTLLEALELEQTYYWRIDEYNNDANITKGRVWAFTVANYLVVDDFEDYNDYEPDRIFDTWIDGWLDPANGSQVGYLIAPYAELDIVRWGNQAMPYFYDNNFKYSEATMTLVSARDWTEEGIGVLSLWFYGDTANAAERMYVNLNGIATVYHDNPDAALIDTWTEWTIDLQDFAAQGVNLANVNTISIGFGDKNSLQAGGSGLVFFDDIRLYRPVPEPAP